MTPAKRILFTGGFVNTLILDPGYKTIMRLSRVLKGLRDSRKTAVQRDLPSNDDCKLHIILNIA